MTQYLLPRTDNSVFGRWWWTVDRWTLGALLALAAFGIVLVMASSPAVANRIGMDDMFKFVSKHLVFLVLSFAGMIVVSLMSPKNIRLLSLAVFALALLSVAATQVIGAEVKGARRWIELPGIGSFQPSEFLKPAFAVVTAWLLAHARMNPKFPGVTVSMASFGLAAGLLIAQPDLGQTVVVACIWFGQYFLAGMPVLLFLVLAVLAAVGLVAAYFTLPHVTSRVDRFLHPEGGDTYQIDKSLEAYANGGVFGTGPGQGTVKMQIPDVHADFIFAVAGEELGLLWSLLIVGLFAFIVLRGLLRVQKGANLFVLLAVSGLLVQFGLQALINMGSSLHLIPTKGMTLPFISYGGSSMVALGMSMGMVLALTRRSSLGGQS